VALGGRAWETLGPVWYTTLLRLGKRAGFAEAAETTAEVAASLHGPQSPTAAAVKAAWKAVGVLPVPPKPKPKPKLKKRA
jgi:Zn-dependent metalloprotease